MLEALGPNTATSRCLVASAYVIQYFEHLGYTIPEGAYAECKPSDSFQIHYKADTEAKTKEYPVNKCLGRRPNLSLRYGEALVRPLAELADTYLCSPNCRVGLMPSG